MKLLFNTIYWLFFATLVGIGLLLLASFMPKTGLGVKVVKSGSMEPAIHTGAIVVIKSQSNYQVGDIVTFGKDTKTQIPTTHRIVAITTDADPVYQTKGDANDAEDHASTHLPDIHGKVILTVPFVGYLLEFVKQPLGFSLVIGVPALVIVLDEIVKIIGEVRRMRIRRKNGGNDRGGPGTPNAPVTSFVPPPVSSKPRSVDGVRVHAREVLKSDVRSMQRKPYLTSAATLVLVFAFTTYVMPVGRTLSYLANMETAAANVFTASSVDLVLGQSDDPTAKESYLHEPEKAAGYVDGATGEKLVFSFATYGGPDSPPFFYIGKGLFDADAAPGCGALQLHAQFNSYSYDGPLNAFVSPATSSTGFWNFEIHLPPGETVPVPITECGGSLVFYAQPFENGGVLEGVFSDTETFTFEAYAHESAPSVAVPLVEGTVIESVPNSTPEGNVPPADSGAPTGDAPAPNAPAGDAPADPVPPAEVPTDTPVE